MQRLRRADEFDDDRPEFIVMDAEARSERRSVAREVTENVAFARDGPEIRGERRLLDEEGIAVGADHGEVAVSRRQIVNGDAFGVGLSNDSDADEIADDRPLIEVDALRAQSAEGRVGTPQSSVATLTRTPSL